MSRELRTETTKRIHILMDCGVKIAEEERKHFYSLKNSVQVDNYARKLLFR